MVTRKKNNQTKGKVYTKKLRQQGVSKNYGKNRKSGKTQKGGRNMRKKKSLSKKKMFKLLTILTLPKQCNLFFYSPL